MAEGCRSVRWLMLRFTQKISWLLFLSVAGVVGVQAADAHKVTFYVQLIRGSDSDKPDDPAWKPVGAKLDKNLRGVFRWRNYWEVKRRTVVLGTGEIRRFHLTADR